MINSIIMEGQVTLLEDPLTRKLELILEQSQRVTNCITEEEVVMKKHFPVKIRVGKVEDKVKEHLSDGDYVRLVGKLDANKQGLFILADHIEFLKHAVEEL